MKFYLYKGLKKPLVLFGLRGKYIYQTLGILATDLVLAAVISSFTGLLGALLILALGGGAIYMIFKIQDKKGLYNKTKNHNEIFVYPNRIGVKILKRNEEKL